MTVVLGVDPSSTVVGLALVEMSLAKTTTDVMLECEAYHLPPVGAAIETENGSKVLDHDGRAFNLSKLRRRLSRLTRLPTIVVVERVAMSRNTNTVRLLAYHEAIAMLYAGEVGAELFMTQATKARRIVLGSGGLDKVEAYKRMKRKRIGREHLPPEDEGGQDVADALCCALAAGELKRERDTARSKA